MNEETVGTATRGDSSSAHRYRGSDRWALHYEDGLLVFSAGADELWATEDATPEVAAELATAWEGETIDGEVLSPEAGALVEQLVAAGILLPELPAGPSWRVALRFVGEGSLGLEGAILAALEGGPGFELARPLESELSVFVRTNGRLTDLYEDAADLRLRPHLLLDVAYDHTVSLGPLVFPGDTACLGCLAGRIGRYWGDAVPPRRPAVQRHVSLIASLLALELEKVAAGDTRLVNSTVTWDLRGWEIRHTAVYKLPWCPFCGEPEPPEGLGSINLPWARTR